MNEQAGKITFPWQDDCTISKQITNTTSVFSLAPKTSISAEYYEKGKLIFVLEGELEIENQGNIVLHANDCKWTIANAMLGMHTQKGCIYVEIEEDTTMNINNEVFQLTDMVPYQIGSIVNKDILTSPHMKFVVMSFDANTGLSEHAAPGDALVFALEGQATITYEGVEHEIHAGETFKFDKLGKHAVTANQRFKMALLISLEG